VKRVSLLTFHDEFVHPRDRLLVYDLDLLVEHLPSEAVDRDMDPVVLLA
jgi:hypothetical protein